MCERLLTYKSTDQKTRELAKEQRRYEHKQLLSTQILEYDAACHLVVFRYELQSRSNSFGYYSHDLSYGSVVQLQMAIIGGGTAEYTAVITTFFRNKQTPRAVDKTTMNRRETRHRRGKRYLDRQTIPYYSPTTNLLMPLENRF